MTAPDFDQAFRDRFRELLRWRRDVRRFRPEPLPDGLLERLIEDAALAPSVGLSQPWRFVRVAEPARRARILVNFRQANARALAGYDGERATLYAGLKLAGLEEAPEHLAVFVEPDPAQGHGLGRATMPETVAYSAVAAIQVLWLAARAEGVGLGWVSILDPAALAGDLDLPADWRFIGYLCLGWPEALSDQPALQQAGWESRRPAAAFLVNR